MRTWLCALPLHAYADTHANAMRCSKFHFIIIPPMHVSHMLFPFSGSNLICLQIAAMELIGVGVFCS